MPVEDKSNGTTGVLRRNVINTSSVDIYDSACLPNGARYLYHRVSEVLVLLIATRNE